MIFHARDLSTALIPSPKRDSAKPFDEQPAYEAQRLIALAAKLIEPKKYLSLMFELAYSNRAIHAMEEAWRWSRMLKERAPAIPNAHWRGILDRDQKGHQTAQLTAKMVAGDGNPMDLLNQILKNGDENSPGRKMMEEAMKGGGRNSQCPQQ